MESKRIYTAIILAIICAIIVFSLVYIPKLFRGKSEDYLTVTIHEVYQRKHNDENMGRAQSCEQLETTKYENLYSYILRYYEDFTNYSGDIVIKIPRSDIQKELDEKRELVKDCDKVVVTVSMYIRHGRVWTHFLDKAETRKVFGEITADDFPDVEIERNESPTLQIFEVAIRHSLL